jgi:hypothetical protein
VEVFYNVSDNCEPVTTTLSVKSNEPESGTSNEDIAGDWEIIDEHHLKLRAERMDEGTGRTYTITITATDAEGNSTTADVTVDVPKYITTMSAAKVDKQTIKTTNDFQVMATPNPSINRFAINIKSNSSEKVNIKVVDNMGRVIEVRRGLSPNATIYVGSKYRSGLYFVEIEQLNNKKVLQLMKQTD